MKVGEGVSLSEITPMTNSLTSVKAENGKNRLAIFTIFRHLRRANGVIFRRNFL
ncbi:hypothetical protein [Pseudanabaena sp. ABRG5-3]|uniref:hypothetical protein n=1 Tax=Pseudanabaena sp. ABRG5-3 TaxID=685565 RepID=UPI0013A61538|nr:hypothetical protein [Pseudanabaena sp. ABRG5-3]